MQWAFTRNIVLILAPLCDCRYGSEASAMCRNSFRLLWSRGTSARPAFTSCAQRSIVVGTEIELEIILVSRPMGRGNVVAATMARVQRIETAAMPGWYGVAATFDELAFDRDDRVPTRFLNP